MPPEAELCCTAGFNRTGFVVCSYLCEAQGFSVSAALAAFAAVRPPGVKHEKFIAELYDRCVRVCRTSDLYHMHCPPADCRSMVIFICSIFARHQGECPVLRAARCMPQSTACLASVQRTHEISCASGTAATTTSC